LAGTVLAASESVASPGGKPLLELVPSLRVQRQSLELALSAPASHVELRHHVRAWRAELKALASDEGAVGTAHYIQGQLKWAEKVAARPLRVVPAEIMVVTLGDLRIAIFPGEVFVEYGIELKRHVSPQQIMTLAFGNAAPGYIPYGTAFMQGGYEVEDAYRFYGFPAPIAPEAGELLLSAMIDLVREAP
jgi:hypothetical protein